MIRKLTIAVLFGLASILTTVKAQTYRGIVEIVPALELAKEFGYETLTAYFAPGVSTTHGMQFNRCQFLGVGAEFDFSHRALANAALGAKDGVFGKGLPVYLMWRMDFFGGRRWSKFIDVRGGWQFGDAPGLYGSASFGMRLRLSDRTGFNISWGVRMRRIQFHPDGSKGEPYDFIKYRTNAMALVMRVGVDF